MQLKLIGAPTDASVHFAVDFGHQHYVRLKFVSAVVTYVTLIAVSTKWAEKVLCSVWFVVLKEQKGVIYNSVRL